MVRTVDRKAASPFDIATSAYNSLALGDRRDAARAFDAALAAAPADPNAAAWRSELRTLRKRWSADAYSLVRAAGDPGLGTAPILGGGQSGASLAWSPDPLLHRPLAVVARATVAHDLGSIDERSAQAAIGVRWQALQQLSLTVERLVALGGDGRDAWTARAAGGGSATIGPARLDAYAEVGVVGAERRDTFASVQTKAVVPVEVHGQRLEPGVGLWAAVQDADRTVHRVDIGPTLAVDIGPLTISADYRFRIDGNAEPASGPALTVSARF